MIPVKVPLASKGRDFQVENPCLRVSRTGEGCQWGKGRLLQKEARDGEGPHHFWPPVVKSAAELCVCKLAFRKGPSHACRFPVSFQSQFCISELESRKWVPIARNEGLLLSDPRRVVFLSDSVFF